ncbi:MAG: DUF4249 domain-containing protein [Cytophagia bacterium]|nr:DUF4249 domain-containing protein [Cytophagia bacterium]
MKKYALFPIVGFLFLSCYSTTEIELSDDESLLVVNSINFQPDSTWLIEISRSQPYLKNNNFKMIDNAIVSIKDENNVEIPLAATNINGKILYTSNQKPAYKNKYVLKISAPGFGDVEATSELPEPVSIENIFIDSTLLKEAYNYYYENGNYGQYEGLNIKCQIIFQDPPETDNYYQLALYRESEGSYIGLDGNPIYQHYFLQSYFYTSVDGPINDMIISDETFNGTLYRWSAYLPIEYFYDFKTRYSSNYKLKLHFVLKHLSKDYYQYKETVQLQNKTINNAFAQPVIIYNNLKNGVGIFAGYSQSVLILNNQ